jgi:hypothetical protein
MPKLTRRVVIKGAAACAALAAAPGHARSSAAGTLPVPLALVDYADVDLHSALHEEQLDHQLQLLMSLDEDSLLKPFRQMIGATAPGPELGGWYSYDPANYGLEGAYAPSATFGQWISALSRMYAVRRRPDIRAKVLRLNRLYAATIDERYYEVNRFPAYCYDKLLCGLIDSHSLVQDPDAMGIMQRTTNAALPHLPGRAIENGVGWRPGKDQSYSYDESYTNSENFFLAYHEGAGSRYKTLGTAYLDEAFYGPLSEGRNNLAGLHAYSYVNSLNSAMQAYLTLGSERHLRAAQFGFSLLTQQSFATGGWGPNERLQAEGTAGLCRSLADSHHSFETPCGSYAHFKLTRYLLRVTGDSTYGDSMERMMYNTILGAKPLLADGRTFYYADFNNHGRKVYSERRWPCCSGTMPQVAADYRINTYFQGHRSLYVNLYLPSTIRWTVAGSAVLLTQATRYPFDSAIEFAVQATQATEFSLMLRIPAWATGAHVAVNGRPEPSDVVPGRFFALRRTWRTGDRVQLELPLPTRLEPIDAEHADIVATVAGPLVLFPIVDDAPAVTRAELMAVRKSGAAVWQASTAAGTLSFLPFTAIQDEAYSTYLQVSNPA